MQAAGPNAEQITYWNETAGPKWVARQDLLDGQIEALGLAAMDLVGIESGDRVLDVGCGTGQTTVELARRVGPGGEVVGADVSAPMLGRARERARAAGAERIALLQADAQTHDFGDATFDVCFSRCGVMFFADPVAAFANLATALRPGGRLGFVCWQSLPDNPWMAVPLMAAAQHVALPPPPAPGAPGPFAFADPVRVRDILARAGFSEVELIDHRATLTVGGTGPLDTAIEFLMDIGPMAALLREAPDPATRSTVAAAIREALEPHRTAHGLRMPSAAWLVRARR